LEVLSVTKGGIVSQKEYFNKEIASKDTSPYKVVRRGEMAMSGLNFWMGAIDILKEYEIGMISPAYKVFRVNYSKIDDKYARYLVRGNQMKRMLVEASVQGASIVRRNLDREMLESSIVHLPPLPEQRAIAAVLTVADREIALLEAELAALREQKRGLMQRLLTGRVRVTVEAEDGPRQRRSGDTSDDRPSAPPMSRDTPNDRPSALPTSRDTTTDDTGPDDRPTTTETSITP
jgi:type I restriction enzyme S subunit